MDGVYKGLEIFSEESERGVELPRWPSPTVEGRK